MHRFLKRQIKESLKAADFDNPGIRKFVAKVQRSYDKFERKIESSRKQESPATIPVPHEEALVASQRQLKQIADRYERTLSRQNGMTWYSCATVIRFAIPSLAVDS